MSELFEHQKEGIAFLKKKKKAILADQMGLGKTRQAIVATGEGADGSTLIVCPASLKTNWEREIHMVYPEDEVVIIQGRLLDEGELDKIAGGMPPWIIINYDILEAHQEWIIPLEKGDNGIESVILDEAHYIKGKSQRSAAALAICKHAKSVFCLTGTPIMNRPIELFNLLKAVEHPLGKYKTHFAKRYCGGQMKTLVRDTFNQRTFFVMPDKAWPFRQKREQYQVFTFMDDTGATRIPELKEMTADIILRRTKKEVLDLPDKIVSTVECELGGWQSEYDNAWDTYLGWIEAHPEGRNINNIMTAQHLVELMKLKQVCSLAKLGKISEDIENAVEQGEKVIVFSQFTQTIEALDIDLSGKKIGHSVLTGSMDTTQRQRSMDRFQGDPTCKVFIANIKAGGVGVNLTAASVVMFADMDWSPAVNEQAEDRAHRIGQEGTVNVYYYIVRGTIEEDIAEVLLDKQGTIGQLMGEDQVQKALFWLVEKRAKSENQQAP